MMHLSASTDAEIYSRRFQQIRHTHCRAGAVSLREKHYAILVRKFFRDSLAEDLGQSGDISTRVAGVGNRQVRAVIIAKSAGLVAGIQEIRIFLGSFKGVRLKILKRDGDSVRKGEIVIQLSGKAADILKVERIVLNLLQRMSGIATLMRRFVEKVPDHVLITPTRKTLWGLLDKRACVVGGGGTHRLNLSDAVLIKDTHLELVDHDFEKVFRSLAEGRKAGRFMEVEVESVADAMRATEMYSHYRGRGALRLPFYLMLDNMKPAQIRKVVEHLRAKKLHKDIFLEASGGINLKNIGAYAKSGVDVISVGALTHSAPALDFSLKVAATPRQKN